MNQFEQAMQEIRNAEQAEIDKAVALMKEGKRHEEITEGMGTGARHQFMYTYADQNENKGKRNGDCNVTQCQSPGAVMWNKGTRAWYCESCARDINRSSFGTEFHPLCITAGEREQEVQDKRMQDAMEEASKLEVKDIGFNFEPVNRVPYRKSVDIGRNEPCPCNSGKKYKKCCGR